MYIIDEKIKKCFELNEQSAMSLTSYCVENNVDTEHMQKWVDKYCSNLADLFLKEHEKELLNPDFISGLRNYLTSIGANDKHSDKRFGYTLLKKLNYTKDEEISM